MPAILVLAFSLIAFAAWAWSLPKIWRSDREVTPSVAAGAACAAIGIVMLNSLIAIIGSIADLLGAM